MQDGAKSTKKYKDYKPVQTVRLRLIDAGIIEPVSRGFVDFAVPYLREHLREHAARYEMQGRLKP